MSGMDALVRAAANIWRRGRRIERIAYVIGAVLFISGLTHLCVLVVSGGTWTGPLSLRKPTTFGLSFGLTLATVAWATSFVAIRTRLRTVLLGLFTVASVVETALVTMQAWRGVPSHFNFETGFDTLVSMTLAAGGGVIVLTAVGFTAAALRSVAATRSGGMVPPSMRLAIRFGFLILLVALATGAVMIARGVVESRDGNPQIAYTTAGALKPLHAVAMHAILVVPGLAWLLRFTDWPERRRFMLVSAAIASYLVLTVVVGIESFTGIPPLDAPAVAAVPSLIAVAGLVATGLTALVAVLRADRGAPCVSP